MKAKLKKLIPVTSLCTTEEYAILESACEKERQTKSRFIMKSAIDRATKVLNKNGN